jgi:signal transduction histidine kinase
MTGTSKREAGAPIPISLRLSLALVAAVLLIMAGYMVVSHQQRRELLLEGLAQEVELLGGVLWISADEMLEEGRVAALDERLRMTLQAEEVFAAVVLDAAGAVMAGDATDLPCLRRHLPAVPAAHQVSGRAGCGAGTQWLSLPLRSLDGSLVVALEEVLIDRSVAAALQRQLLLVLALVLTLAAAILVILRRVLSEPLDRIMTAVRALAETGTAPPVRLDPSAGELVQLAEVLNDTVAQLEAKRAELLRQAEEQLALERKLRVSEKFATIGRLSGGLAHELGSPLSVIGMRADALRGAADAAPAARIQAEAISMEVHRMSLFLEGLLHMSRQRGILFERVDITEVLRAVVADLAGHAERAHVGMQFDSEAGPVTVLGQETLLRHALRNLVRNAIQALRDHPGERRVWLRMSRNTHEIRITVEDNGPGIPEDQMKEVFQPFYTTRDATGIGLGLPISHGIIEEHGGELHLENRVEGGACAVVVLPLPPEP